MDCLFDFFLGTTLLQKKSKQSQWFSNICNMETYVVHSNGGRPFQVILDTDAKTYAVYAADESESEYTEVVVAMSSYLRAFVGENDAHSASARCQFMDTDSWEPGNTVLLRVPDCKGRCKYVFVGDAVYEFFSDTPILSYWSPIGRSDVPYPYAMTETETFMLTERWRLPNAAFEAGLHEDNAAPMRCTVVHRCWESFLHLHTRMHHFLWLDVRGSRLVLYEDARRRPVLQALNPFTEWDVSRADVLRLSKRRLADRNWWASNDPINGCIMQHLVRRTLLAQVAKRWVRRRVAAATIIQRAWRSARHPLCQSRLQSEFNELRGG
jgi:hypothetical protein